jgi:hypothetical protein
VRGGRLRHWRPADYLQNVEWSMTLNKDQKDAIRAALETIDGKLAYRQLAPSRFTRLQKAKVVLLEMLHGPAEGVVHG